MPFSGTFNRWGHATPPNHPCYDDGRKSCTDSYGIADWSTDLFAGGGTAVRPRIYAPINGASYVLRVRRVSTSACAGKNVHVGIFRNGSFVGNVSYAHLANVPAFATNQAVTTGTVLGTLHWWKGCTSSYDVTNESGIHSHVEVGAVAGRACYMPWGVNRPLGDTRMIGKFRPGYTITC